MKNPYPYWHAPQRHAPHYVKHKLLSTKPSRTRGLARTPGRVPQPPATPPSSTLCANPALGAPRAPMQVFWSATRPPGSPWPSPLRIWGRFEEHFATKMKPRSINSDLSVTSFLSAWRTVCKGSPDVLFLISCKRLAGVSAPVSHFYKPLMVYARTITTHSVATRGEAQGR